MTWLFFQNEVPLYDQVLLSRMFVQDEANALKTDRELVSSGKCKCYLYFVMII